MTGKSNVLINQEFLLSPDCEERVHNPTLCRAGAAIKDSSSVYGGEHAI